ncbi:MAG: signal peptidase I [Clostridium sp.]|nr:signal peptidase I [Clostridium sp.]
MIQKFWLYLYRGGIITSKNSVIKEILDWSIHIIIAILLGLFIVNFVAQITIVSGSSMEITLHDGDRLIIEKIGPRFNKLKRGDIVTINSYPNLEAERSPIIKRIIGIEGDKVEIRDGKVFVNDISIEENYINVGSEGTLQVEPQYSEIIVPKGHIYVLGDNRLPACSKDSRVFGTVSIGSVGGRAFFRFYPLNKIGFLSN